MIQLIGLCSTKARVCASHAPVVRHSDERSQKWLQTKDEGGDACRHAKILRVMAAAQIDGVHQKSGDQHVLEFRAARPGRAQQNNDGHQQTQRGQKAQRKEGERGSVLNARLTGKIA